MDRPSHVTRREFLTGSRRAHRTYSACIMLVVSLQAHDASREIAMAHTPGSGMKVFVGLAAAAALFASGVVTGRYSGDVTMEVQHPKDMGAMHGGDGAGMGGAPGMVKGARPGSQSSKAGGMGGSMMEHMNVSSEADYMARMIPHHEEAIAAAKILKEGTDRKEMRTFADAIVADQQAQVDDMREWLQRWYPETEVDDSYEPMMRDNLDQLSGDKLDQAFLEDMIGHHMMAVHMSQSLLDQDFTKHDEVDELARSIKTSQSKEIGDMQDDLADWFDVHMDHEHMMSMGTH